MAGRFALDIRKFRGKVNERLNIIIAKVTLQAGRNIIFRTPVDTGAARANWQTAFNEPDLSMDRQPDENAREAIDQLQSVATSAQFGQQIFITNNLPYIEALEDGHSQQAPRGMVKVTLREMPGVVEESVFEAKRERP